MSFCKLIYISQRINASLWGNYEYAKSYTAAS